MAGAVTQSPYHCNLLVAGYDEGVGPSLYWLDYLATLHKVNTGGTGYGECIGWWYEAELFKSLLYCIRDVRATIELRPSSDCWTNVPLTAAHTVTHTVQPGCKTAEEH